MNGFEFRVGGLPRLRRKERPYPLARNPKRTFSVSLKHSLLRASQNINLTNSTLVRYSPLELAYREVGDLLGGWFANNSSLT